MTVERTLHHFPLDPASRQVRLALGEKRLAFSEVVERVWEQRPELLALNPSGLTPILVEVRGGKRLVLCENRPMLDLVKSLGFTTGPCDEPGTVEAVLDLA